jgi:hypothetical protein
MGYASECSEAPRFEEAFRHAFLAFPCWSVVEDALGRTEAFTHTYSAGRCNGEAVLRV